MDSSQDSELNAAEGEETNLSNPIPAELLESYIRYDSTLEIYKHPKVKKYVAAFFALMERAGFQNFVFKPNGSKESSHNHDLNVDMILQVYLFGITINDFEGSFTGMDVLMFKTWFKANKSLLKHHAGRRVLDNQILLIMEARIEELDKEGLTAAQTVGNTRGGKGPGRHTKSGTGPGEEHS